jgi:hypothetical protein
LTSSGFSMRTIERFIGCLVLAVRRGTDRRENSNP